METAFAPGWIVADTVLTAAKRIRPQANARSRPLPMPLPITLLPTTFLPT
jgi:hypothetical protein